MTRTEERLRDALGAAAAQVRDDRLRPLPPPEAADTTKTPKTTLRRHMGWLGPAAAAMSVLLIVALALAMAGPGHKSHSAVNGWINFAAGRTALDRGSFSLYSERLENSPSSPRLRKWAS